MENDNLKNEKQCAIHDVMCSYIGLGEEAEIEIQNLN